MSAVFHPWQIREFRENDLHLELVFRLTEDQSLGHRCHLVVVNRRHDHSVHRLRNGESEIRWLIRPQRDRFKCEFFSSLA